MSRTEDQLASLRNEIVAAVRHRTGMHEQQALDITTTMIDVLRSHFGGSRFYVGRRRRYDKAALLRDFRGDNVDEVCRRYQIHKVTFYRILRREKGAAPRAEK